MSDHTRYNFIFLDGLDMRVNDTTTVHLSDLQGGLLCKARTKRGKAYFDGLPLSWALCSNCEAKARRMPLSYRHELQQIDDPSYWGRYWEEAVP